MKPAIREAIVVEGRYDKNTLAQIVDTAIFETGGFRILRDRETLEFLRHVAEKRGLVIFTDSDGAGFVIRNKLKGSLPGGSVLHAYIPDIPGKEKRKMAPSKEGLLGVEGMEPQVILDALRRAGAHFLDGTEAARGGEITRQDLFRLGLTGSPGSAGLRDRIKAALALPRHLSTAGLLDALNLITDLKSLQTLTEQYKEETNQ